jgi:hypothetical protein
MFRWLVRFTLAVLLVWAPVAVSHTAERCTVPQAITRFKTRLPHTSEAIRSGQSLVIVAIGSSSTKGVGASDSAHTYPAVLAKELQRRWPRLPVTVINQGIGGEMASATLARFERDVFPYHPQLVIWQTGSNEALRSGPIDGYAETLREGISRLVSARADVVLMDPQFAPPLSSVRSTCSSSMLSMKAPKIRRWLCSDALLGCGTGYRAVIIRRRTSSRLTACT